MATTEDDGKQTIGRIVRKILEEEKSADLEEKILEQLSLDDDSSEEDDLSSGEEGNACGIDLKKIIADILEEERKEELKEKRPKIDLELEKEKQKEVKEKEQIIFKGEDSSPKIIGEETVEHMVRRILDEEKRAEQQEKKKIQELEEEGKEINEMEEDAANNKPAAIGRLHVQLLEAKYLRTRKDAIYCAVISQDFRDVSTTVHKNTAKWIETQFDILVHQPEAVLELLVYAEHRLRDKVVGRLSIPISDLTSGQRITTWYKLESKREKLLNLTKKDYGEVYLSLLYTRL